MAQATIGRLESELRELKMQLQHAKDEVSASAEALRSERDVSKRLQEEVTALRDENLALQVSMPLSGISARAARTERRRGAQHMNDELYAELEAGLEGGADAPDASRANAGQTPLPPPPPARAAQPEPEGVGAGGFSVAEQLARLKAKESQQMPRVSYMSPAAEKETEGVRAWEGRLDASRRESGAGQAAEAPQASQEGAERAAVTVSLGSNVARMAAGGTGSEAELSHLQALLKRSEKARAAGCVSNPCLPPPPVRSRDSLCHHRIGCHCWNHQGH